MLLTTTNRQKLRRKCACGCWCWCVGANKENGSKVLESFESLIQDQEHKLLSYTFALHFNFF